MPSDRTIRTQLTNTYLQRAIETKDEVQGRFAKEEASTIVGAGAAYPPTVPGSPWNDPTAKVLNSAADVTGQDSLAAPVVGEPFEQAEAALRRTIAQAQYEQRMMDASDPRVQEIQVRIDAAMNALERRRK